MSTESADKTEPSDLDLFCYGLYLRAVSGDDYLAGVIPKEKAEMSMERTRASYAIAQGVMMNRRMSHQGGAYASEPAEPNITLMSCRQLSEQTTRALQWIV